MSVNSKPQTQHIGGLILSIVLAVVGWGGLYYLIWHVHPNLQTRYIFLVLWSFALAGTAWPVLLAVNQRWSRNVTWGRVWRQSIWIALFGVLTAWLQMNGAMTLSLAVTIGGTIGLVEILLILRDREEAKNKESDDDT